MIHEAVVFGQLIRKIRKQKGLTQDTLSFESGINRTFISSLERGAGQPSISTIVKLARALGTTPALLLAQVSGGVQSEGEALSSELEAFLESFEEDHLNIVVDRGAKSAGVFAKEKIAEAVRLFSMVSDS